MFDWIYVRTILLYVVAGLAEIGGGWLVWQWLREGRGLPLGLLGGAVLFGYGMIHTTQAEFEFGRVYAAYGGIFIVLALVWGRLVDDWRPELRPDRRCCRPGGRVYSLVGQALVLSGICRRFIACGAEAEELRGNGRLNRLGIV
jgi:small multidrug resistance family-3 protein